LEELRASEFYKTLTSPKVRTERELIDSSISSLINYIHNDKKSYEFDRIKVDYRMDNLGSAGAEGEVEMELNLNDLQQCKQVSFFDAVSLEQDSNVPVLLLEIHDLIDKVWIGKSYSKFRTLMDCPLLANVDGCIGHVFSYESVQQLMQNTRYDEDNDIYRNLVNPMTNNVVYGGLVFSHKADEYNDYVLYMTLFKGKKVRMSSCF